ncbi:glycosyltransferase family 2 protein [Aerosakkonemataceae cyanobacterium BLCC-F154]|uniref:Glycosyltransferase family 2 protein n=1 Tax=Floridaenema fluviatile BLCC-F154 TaxID=3153640 RepID=A0ABV4Y6E8_9CYAN
MLSYPLVSICIPVYNAGEFIASLIECLQSITYPNREIIISDDASEDDSLKLLQSANLPNCRIFTHPRYGLVENWNFCISQAQGKYVKFLFQDDAIAPNCITKMVELAEQDEEIGLVFCPRRLVFDRSIDANFVRGMQDLHKRWTRLQSIQSGLTLLRDRKFFQPPYNKIGEPTNVLIRRQVFQQIGLFDPAFKQLCDLEMWWRIMADYHIGFIDEELASFRIHATQTTSRNLESDRIATLFEIYKVWLKIIFNKTYHSLPQDLRQNLRQELIKILLIKGAKSIILLRWYQAQKVKELLTEALVTKLELASDE